MKELRLEDGEGEKMFLRMNAETFDELLNLIQPDLEKQTNPSNRPDTTTLQTSSSHNKVFIYDFF